MRIILGLGNPGLRYALSRHNVGFLAVDRLASEIGARFRVIEERLEVAQAKAFGEELILAKPLTYMNWSGKAAAELAVRHSVPPQEFMVVYDDIALPLGRLRLRARGSAGGQRGMQSVVEHLQTREIPRLRLGILGKGERRDLAEYVLQAFDPDEWPVVEKMLERSVEALALAVSRGVPVAASKFNRMEAPQP
ncbi:MAG: aminoacyl-tRNA hydrolase [Acidobacteria bacterium]|nr:MAG: aminoacyl-tRNA hydrolase [Acidobacteriota bacterium]